MKTTYDPILGFRENSLTEEELFKHAINEEQVMELLFDAYKTELLGPTLKVLIDYEMENIKNLAEDEISGLQDYE